MDRCLLLLVQSWFEEITILRIENMIFVKKLLNIRDFIYLLSAVIYKKLHLS